MRRFPPAGLLVAIAMTALLGGCGKPLVQSAALTQITMGQQKSTHGFFTVNFGLKQAKPVYLSAAVDWNKDGSYEDSEWMVTNAPARARADWNNNFPVIFPKEDLTGLKTHIVITDTVTDPAHPVNAQQFDMPLSVTPYDIGTLIDLSTVTNPTESMKGDTVERPGTGTPTASNTQDQGVPDSFQNDTPDLPQRKDECAPTSAANSIIRLAGDHNRIDAIPRDPTALIDMLKQQMGWTPQNGVLTGDFSPGKEYVAKQLGLPITSETVSGDFNHVIDRIEETLNKGGAAEMRLQSTVTDENGQTHNVGGHMVTVVGVVRNGQQTSVQIHDPLSPSGTDTYEIDPNDGSLIKYPFLGGKLSDAVHVRLTTGFIQTWIEQNANAPVNVINDITPSQRSTIKVIVAYGHKIPLSEVYVADPGQCPADHYHASRNGTAKALDGTMVPDAAPEHCGYGKVSEVPVENCTPDGQTCTPVATK